MLEGLRGGQRWITTLIIGSIALIFVLFLGLQGPMTGGGPGSVVTVGPYQFGFREFERARARREAALQEQLGAQFDAKALGDTLDQITARELVDRALLALEASDMGLSVSKQEIERMVLADPGLRGEDGKFDVERFNAWAQYEYGSQTAFINERRLALLSFKMIELLNAQPHVSVGEARDAVERDLEEVQIAFVVVGGDSAKGDEKIDDAAVQKALAERGEELHKLYEERSGLYNVPEKIRARHILFAVPAGSDDASVAKIQSEADEALAKLRGGADFAELAKARSDDPGSKSNGGDLGLFGRGQMVPAFDEAAFALQETGQLSGVVRTDYGFHIIRLEERQAAVTRSYDEVSAELARDLLTQEARKARARKQADDLVAAIQSGKSLEEAAGAADLPLARSGLLRRRADGYVPGLGPAPEVLAAAFMTDVGKSLPTVFEVGDRLALVQVIERKPAAEDQIQARLDARRQQLLDEKRDERTTAWLDRRRDELLEAGKLQVALENLGRPAPQPRRR
ncbi:MAG TPA: peptidylprolyl isomerase [Myxococcota bacterium]|nr:peptidylprolyl isomerase [Myxococcota bacterium]